MIENHQAKYDIESMISTGFPGEGSWRKKKKPTVGFEPTTTGLQNQSSTTELRWHNCFSIYAYIDLKVCIILLLSGNCCKKIKGNLCRNITMLLKLTDC